MYFFSVIFALQHLSDMDSLYLLFFLQFNNCSPSGELLMAACRVA